MLIFLNGLWWGFLRRWFGGLFPDEKYKVLGNRGLQTTVMILSLLPIIWVNVQEVYAFSDKWVTVIFVLAITLWIQFQFWSRGHGGTFGDMGRTIEPDESRYDRWFKIPLDYIWEKVFELKSKNITVTWLLQNWSGRKYGYTYDMIYHGLRYTLCMIPVTLLLNNFNYTLIGLLSAPIYEMNLRFYERKHYSWMNKPWLNMPSKLTEIEYGFIFGILIML